MGSHLEHAAGRLKARIVQGYELKRCVQCGRRGLFPLGPEIRRLYGLLYRCRYCGRSYKKPITFLTSRGLKE